MASALNFRLLGAITSIVAHLTPYEEGEETLALLYAGSIGPSRSPSARLSIRAA